MKTIPHLEIEISKRWPALIAVALCSLTLIVYWPVQYHEFLLWDDYSYIVENPNVSNGLDLKSVLWAFSSSHSSNWHPLTWLSHMMDAELYGLNPAGHHWSNLILHISNALLLFFVLRAMSGSLWRSALTAALFSIHPIHVESVAWASERKDVLSVLFWMLTLLAYVKYTKKPGWMRYVAALSFFALALTSKAMVVTLPFVMLLLDYWPLRRFNKVTERENEGASVLFRLVVEKAPFFAMSAGCSVVTFLVQRSFGAVDPFLTLDIRIANGLVSYVRYILNIFWPANLAFFYPHPLYTLSQLQAAGSFLFLVLITIAALVSAKNRPYLAVGWLWFLGTLVPVIGIVQVGGQAMADRFTYLPQVGLAMAVVWGTADFATRSRAGKIVFSLLSLVTVFSLALSSQHYLRFWKDSLSLFSRAIEVTENNPVAHFLLGEMFMRGGKIDQAIFHYSQAVKIRPDNAKFLKGLGSAMIRQGDTEGATQHLKEAIRILPGDAEALTNLGSALLQQGKMDEAMEHLKQALRIKPLPEAHHNLAKLFAGQGRSHEAVSHYQQALALRPGDAWIHNDLGLAFYSQLDYENAFHYLSEALRLDPGNHKIRHNLYLVRKQIGNPATPVPDGLNAR